MNIYRWACQADPAMRSCGSGIDPGLEPADENGRRRPLRTVLCFGDSNTHGQIPGRGPLERYRRDQRWGGVLEKNLGPGWQVIEEGLSGRTTVRDDPIEGPHKN